VVRQGGHQVHDGSFLTPTRSASGYKSTSVLASESSRPPESASGVPEGLFNPKYQNH
jgi:hypothetical protein